MKSELLVTAGQHTAVNMFPGLVHTARHVMGVSNTRSRWANRKEAAVEGGTGDWDEVVNHLRPLAGDSERQKIRLFAGIPDGSDGTSITRQRCKSVTNEWK